MKATPIKQMIGWKGEATLYRLDPAYKYQHKTQPIEYVVVSAVDLAHYGAEKETYIFKSNETGTKIDWEDLPGSYKGGMDHAEALRGLGEGYEINET